MPPSNLRSAVEALLFSSDQSLTLTMLADALEATPQDVTAELQSLAEGYAARGAGVELREISGGWMIVTTPEQHEWVARMLRGKRRMRLSRAALETMAIVAYKQPVTKSEIEAIRGVDSSGTLATLLERNLVTIKGRSTVVGRPLLYGTTSEFLNYFGLRDLQELPRPEELRALVAAREPEQMEMLELDADGMPLALAAGAILAGTNGEGGAALTASMSAAPDAAGSDADFAVADALLVAEDGSSSGPGDDEEEEESGDEDDEDEFDDDDEDDEDGDEDGDEDDADEEDEDAEHPSARLTESERH